MNNATTKLILKKEDVKSVVVHTKSLPSDQFIEKFELELPSRIQ